MSERTVLAGNPRVADGTATAAEQSSWARARAMLDGVPDGGLNIAYEAVDRHVAHGRGGHVALRFVGATGVDQEWTYAELADRTSRFAEVLRGLGVGPGDLVCGLSGRLPDLYVALLGTLKARSVFSPLFSTSGPEPILYRLRAEHARVLVTTPQLYRREVAALRDQLPELEHVLLIGPGAEDLPSADDEALGVHSLAALSGATTGAFTVEPTDPEETALVHVTSGTAGTPTATIHVHDAVVAHHVTAVEVLDLHDSDVFWCTAEIGWITGTCYGVIAPLTCGVTCVVDELEFDARRWYELLESQRVSVWYTTATALRMLKKAGLSPLQDRDLSALRHIASVGEPLNPEVVHWGVEVLERDIHDTWLQTETGAILIASPPGIPVRAGAIGCPVPEIEVGLVKLDPDGAPRRGADGQAALVEEPGTVGELALLRPWPSMMRTYLAAEARCRAVFIGDWYLTGDLARRDNDGWYRFVARRDDVITCAGHLIGPFEVESVLMEHPAVAEAGVIGVPDPIAGEVVKAFVSLRSPYEPSDELRLTLIGFARRHLGDAAAPRDIVFADDLPKTRSGQIMRRLLKARELGLPEGDLSTLERPS